MSLLLQPAAARKHPHFSAFAVSLLAANVRKCRCCSACGSKESHSLVT